MRERTVTINCLVKNITLEVIKLLFPPSKIGRKPKHTNEEYLKEIFYVLKEGIGWDYSKGLKVTGDALRKIFKKWTDGEVFKLVWAIVVDIYSTFKLDFNDVFIDASFIKNYMGSETVGKNHYDRFKKATKLSIITDDIGAPIGIILDKGNVHDIKLVTDTIRSIQLPLNSVENLIADKGYCSKSLKGKLYRKYMMQLITPRKKKKGQKGKIRGRKPKLEYKLKDRFIVEHTFAWFKHYARLFRRKDRKIKNFESFVFLGASNIIGNKLNHLLNYG